MYPSPNAKHGPLKLNQFAHQKYLDHNIMLKTIQSLCYNKPGHPFNMTSPFLVDNILHQQKITNFHQQYHHNTRENTPDLEEPKQPEEDESRTEEPTDDSKIEHDDDSKSRDDDEPPYVKSETYFNEYYQHGAEKEVLNIPNLARRCINCGGFECSPFACKKSGLRRLEELERRFSLYQDNSGDEGTDHREERRGFATDIGRGCEEKKPLLKFSVSAILGEREDGVKANGISGEYL